MVVFGLRYLFDTDTWKEFYFLLSQDWQREGRSLHVPIFLFSSCSPSPPKLPSRGDFFHLGLQNSNLVISKSIYKWNIFLHFMLSFIAEYTLACALALHPQQNMWLGQVRQFLSLWVFIFNESKNSILTKYFADSLHRNNKLQREKQLYSKEIWWPVLTSNQSEPH